MVTRLSPHGRRLLQGFEGLSLKSYRDPPVPDPADQLWSIGYGHQLGRGPSFEGRTITRQEAEELFDRDVASRESLIALTAPTDVSHRFDALVSLAYNIGNGAFGESTVKRLHNAGDHAGAADAFRMWRKSAGAVNPVLVARREQERAVYLDGYASPYLPESGPVEPAAPVAASESGESNGMVLAGLGLVFFCPGCGVRSASVCVERVGD
jgi:lysozyme